MFIRLIALVSLFLAPSLQGASVYWDINGTATGAGGATPAGTWDAATARWNSSSAGTGAVAAWVAGNVAIFAAGTDATGTYTVTVSGTHDIAGLTFEEGAVTLDGGTLNWVSGGGISVATSRTAIINSVLTGTVAVAKTGSGILRLTGTNANTLSGDFTVSSGTLDLAKSAGVNAIGTGNLIINSTSGLATVILSENEQIADTATVSINSTSTSNFSNFQLNGKTETIAGLTLTTVTGAGAQVMTGANGRLIVKGNISLNNNRSATSGNNARDILITGTGTDGTAAPNTGFLDLGGGVRTITVATTATAGNNTDDDATIETIIENGGIIKEGARMLILSGDNTFTGGTTINQGTLRIGAGGTTGSIVGNVVNNSALEFNRSNASVYAGNISGTGTVTKLGAGTLELSGTNTFTGTLSVTGGVLQYSTNTNLGGTGSHPITLNGGNLQYTGIGNNTYDGTISVTASSTLSNIGTGVLTISNIANLSANLTVAGSSAIEFTGVFGQAAGDRTVTITNTAGVTFNNIALTESATTARTMIFNVAAGASATINGVIANGNTPSSAFRMDGAGTAIVLSSPTFTNELRLNNGTLVLRASMAGQTSTNSLVFSNTSVAGSLPVLELDGAAVIYNLTGNVIYAASGGQTGTASIEGSGSLSLNGSTRTFEVRPSDGTDSELVVSANIINGTGSPGVSKTRNGTLVLAGSNTYTGATTIAEGVVRLDYRNNIDSKISSTGALTMNGGTLELVGNASTAVTQAAGAYTVGQGANRIIVNDNGGPGMTLTLGALTATAAGRSLDVVLTGANAAVKPTGWTLTNGMLGGWATFNSSSFATVDGSGNIAGITATVKDNVSSWLVDENVSDGAGFSGATSTFAKIHSLTFQAGGSSVQVTDTLDIASGGILAAASAGTYSITGGRLTTTNGAFFIHQFNQSNALTISSLIGGSVSLTKSGEGELILDSAANTYTGATFVNKGTLTISGGNAIGDASAVTLDAVTGVTLKLMNDETIGTLAGGSADGGTVNLNGQTLTLSNGSTFSGRFTGAGTIVKWGTTNFSVNTSASTGFTGTVVVNQGLVNLTGNGIANMTNATLWKLNPGGGLLIDNNGSSSTPNRVGDTAALTLNSANGVSGTAAPYRGLWTRTDQNGGRVETVGTVTLDSGSSYATLEALTTGTNSSSIAQITAANLVRNNRATFNVRGTNLGTAATTNGRTFFRLATGAEATFTGLNLIGGAGASGGATMSIVPWAVGQDLGLNLLSTSQNSQRGNSLVTYVATAGFRPLNLTSEYSTYSAASLTSNVRESLVADLTGLTGKTINALVIDNASSADAITVDGSGSLVVTSGAFLFTAVDSTSLTFAELASPKGITLGGFSDITVGPVVGAVGNEFIFHVSTSAAAGVTVTSNLINSTAGSTALTKSGIGTLILTGNNTYSGTTTLNEGVLEIDAWESIGGTTGNAGITFAGGTLRLQNGFTGDLNRTGVISLAQGGGTVDTNGADISFNTSLVDVAGMNGSFTKTGLGTLTLGAASTYTGTTTVLNGTLKAGVNQAIGLGNLVVNGGTLNLQSFNAAVGRVTLAGAGSQILGTGTLTSNNSVFDVQSGVIGANLAGSSKLVKTTASTVILTGVNTYTGGTLVSEGVLRASPGAGLSSAGPVELNGGVLEMNGTFSSSIGTGAGQLIVTGGASGFSAFGGALTVDLGTANWGTFNFNPSTLILNNATSDSLLNWATNLTLNGAARTISVQASTARLSGVVSDGSGSGGLTKIGDGTLEFGASHTYTGATSVNLGTLKIVTDQNLSGALQFGSANNITTAGRVELDGASAQFGGLLVQTNSDANTNELVIGGGETLTINGNVMIGTNAGAATTTRFSASGAGEFIVNNTASGSFFQVGGANTAGSQANRAIADFGDLAKMTVNLNTTSGVFRVNPTNTNNVSNRYSTVTLAKITTITANAIVIGDSAVNNASPGQVNTLFVGEGANEFYVNSISIGNGTRDMGAIRFDVANTTGTLKVRGTGGDATRATFTMGAAGGGTGVGGDGNVFDMRGHNVDLLFGATTIGTQNRLNALTNNFYFDTGKLQMTSLTMAGRTGGSTSTGAGLSRNTTSTMDIGGGVVIIDNGILSLASVAGGYNIDTNPAPTVTGTINITGGQVTIGHTLGTAVVMGGNTATTTGATPKAVADINITGGQVTVQGNITRGAVSGAGLTAGAVSATVTLDGGLLDMSGNAIGSGLTNGTISFVARSGTLRNLGQLNGGGTMLEKVGSGVLKLGGTNSYSGGTRVLSGTLEVLAGGNTGSANVRINGATAVLGGTGTVGSTVLEQGSIQPGATSGDPIGTLTIQSGLSMTTSAGASSLVMQLRGATGKADLSSYSVSDIPTMASALVLTDSGDHDHLEINGSIFWETGVNGATRLVVEDLGVNYEYGMVFNLIDWVDTFGIDISLPTEPISGGNTAYDVDLPDLASKGLLWDLSLLKEYGALVVVPEPGRALLIGVGLVSLLLRRRRRGI